MKKLLSYSFLLLFLYGVIGYYPVFLIRQNSVRTEIKTKIKNSIPRKELLVLSFTKAEYENIRWVKQNKEFHFGNNLYDVIHQTTLDDGSVVLSCINDFTEKQLFVNLEKEVQKNSTHSPDGKNLQNIFKILSACFPNDMLSGVVPTLLIRKKTSILSHVFFQSFIGNIPFPPPKTV